MHVRDPPTSLWLRSDSIEDTTSVMPSTASLAAKPSFLSLDFRLVYTSRLGAYVRYTRT